jgi:nitrogen fixation-related uncharacterized protein
MIFVNAVNWFVFLLAVTLMLIGLGVAALAWGKEREGP